VERVRIESRIAGSRGPLQVQSFADRPPVVRAGDAVVDLLPGVLPHIVDEDASGKRLHRERERIAQTQRPDLPAGARHADERIVRWDRTVLVDAQDLSEEVPEVLGVVPVRVFSDRDVELPVDAEVESSAVVVRCAGERVELENDRLAAGLCDVPVGREAADPVVPRVAHDRVIDVHVLIGREVRIERDAEQAPLTRGVHGEGDERGRQQSAVLDDPERAALLADENAFVGSDRHRRRIRQSPDVCLREASRERPRGCPRVD
jgi:hypothetical protein